jgi:hypothetical protein
VIRLDSPATVARLEQSWQFLSLHNVASPATIALDGLFFVAGYPVSMTNPIAPTMDLIRGRFFTVFTQRFLETPAEAEEPVSQI